MPGKTISAYTNEETARLVEHLAKVEQRKPSQIAAAALALYARLPGEAHSTLRSLEMLGDAGEYDRMLREVTRAILEVGYHSSVRRMMPRLKQVYGTSLQTEDDIMAEAVRLTSRKVRKPNSARSRSETADAQQDAPQPRRRAR
ncbi:hypothetical protein [Longimicrobium sp.]|uniref:hypothetical protein n=1 Tax=Longimicrobium sp. TaxID=2029185 RepID=UPI002B62E1FE|nr:hypothetical protein [Longimicrobium sp.]HSU17212.1 hypothetical protein [Longimicrobium sp.]